MIAFDHRLSGTAEAEWAVEPRLLAARELPLPQRGDRLLVVAAHPDDETLGAGGLIAACARRGISVSVVVATDGEASHPQSPTVSPTDLAAMRRAEVQAALDRLAPGVQVRFLGLPDGGLERHRADLAAQVGQLGRDATHVASPWTGDRHPDHAVCGDISAELAAARGAEHWQYPIWAWHWGDPQGGDLPFEQLAAVPLEPADHLAKTSALHCHVSQHRPLSPAAGDEAILTPQMLEHFTRVTEYFVADAPASRSVAGVDGIVP